MSAANLAAFERLVRSTWDSRVMPSKADVGVLLDQIEAMRALADKAVSCVEDAVRETSWGQPTFSPDAGEELRAEFEALAAHKATLHAG